MPNVININLKPALNVGCDIARAFVNDLAKSFKEVRNVGVEFSSDLKNDQKRSDGKNVVTVGLDLNNPQLRTAVVLGAAHAAASLLTSSAGMGANVVDGAPVPAGLSEKCSEALDDSLNSCLDRDAFCEVLDGQSGAPDCDLTALYDSCNDVELGQIGEDYCDGAATRPPTASTAPTTASPTTASPTTADPTTADPTTADPTTVSPTTADPTTASPTTASPTTASPTTASPTTASPTTASPTTASPTTPSSTTPSSTTARTTSTTTGGTSTEDASGSNVGAIVGGVVGAVAGVAAVTTVAVLCLKDRFLGARNERVDEISQRPFEFPRAMLQSPSTVNTNDFLGGGTPHHVFSSGPGNSSVVTKDTSIGNDTHTHMPDSESGNISSLTDNVFMQDSEELPLKQEQESVALGAAGINAVSRSHTDQQSLSAHGNGPVAARNTSLGEDPSIPVPDSDYDPDYISSVADKTPVKTAIEPSLEQKKAYLKNAGFETAGMSELAIVNLWINHHSTKNGGFWGGVGTVRVDRAKISIPESLKTFARENNLK